MRHLIALSLLFALPACTRPEAARCTGDEDCLNGFSCEDGTCERTPDAGTDVGRGDAGPVDGGGGDDAPIDGGSDAPGADDGALSGSWGCRGTRTGSGMGATATSTIEVIGSDMSGLSASDIRAQAGVADVEGCALCAGTTFTFPIGAQFSVHGRVGAAAELLETRWVGSAWRESMGRTRLTGFTRPEFVAIAESLGVEDSLILEAGIVIADCDRMAVANASLRIFAEPVGDVTSLLAVGYGGGEGATDESGNVFVAAGGSGLGMSEGTVGYVTLEAWGVIGTGEPQRVACEHVPIEPNALTIVELGPLRGDYGPGHPCL